MEKRRGPPVVYDRPVDMRTKLTPGLELARAGDIARIRELKLLIKMDGLDSDK